MPSASTRNCCLEGFAMVNQHKQCHVRMVMPTRARRWLVGLLSGAALLWLGLTWVVDSLHAQPMAESAKNDRPAAQMPPVTDLPPFNIDGPPARGPLAFQPDPLPKNVPLPPPEKMPGEKLPAAGGELPQPRPLDFGPDRPGMRSLPEGPNHLGATPRPTEEDIKESNLLVDHVIDPRLTFDVIENQSRIIILKLTPTKIQVVDEGIIGHNLIEPKQMLVLGRKTGTTVMTIWFNDPNAKGKERILSYLVRCLPDPERKHRLGLIYKALEREIHKRFPDSMIRIEMVGDKVMVSGEAKDIQDATNILRIVRGNTPDNLQRLAITNLNVNLQTNDLLNERGTPGLDSFITAGGPNIINLIRIPGEQQVMLRVTVAEVDRTAARSIGLNFSVTNNDGVNVFSQLTGGITITPNAITGGASSSTGGVPANLVGSSRVDLQACKLEYSIVSPK